MRIGLREMRAFSKLLFSSVRDNTFFESCGVADLITTCRMISNTSPFPIHISQSQIIKLHWLLHHGFAMAVGGRNRKVAEAFARSGGKRLFSKLCQTFFWSIPRFVRIGIKGLSVLRISNCIYCWYQWQIFWWTRSRIVTRPKTTGKQLKKRW